jgi:hypothetical protein
MAHYAKVNNNIVEKVIVAEADFFETFVDTSPGQWIQTSYNTHGGIHSLGGTPLRKNYAGVGYTYDSTLDAFYAPKPYASWSLDTETCLWNPPVAYPDDGETYNWNESTTSWDLVEQPK